MTLAAAILRGPRRADAEPGRDSWFSTSLYRQGAYTFSFDLNTS